MAVHRPLLVVIGADGAIDSVWPTWREANARGRDDVVGGQVVPIEWPADTSPDLPALQQMVDEKLGVTRGLHHAR